MAPAKKTQTIIDPLGDAHLATPYRYSITSYGADYPVDALVKRLAANTIYVPHFQRDFVWNLTQASRFIESLLLGLPVPGIFLSQDHESSKLSVLDGLQRLTTLSAFYEGVFPKSDKRFRLKGVQEEFEGRGYADLDENDRIALDNFIIHCTIVRQDNPTDDQSSIYYLFERINTGGTQLSAQEIRTCLFFGPFVDLLAELNKNKEWRTIFGAVNKRMRDQELILRFFGLLYSPSEYARPMKTFLNKALGHNRHLDRIPAIELENIFNSTINTLYTALGEKAFRPQRSFNAAVFDSVMVGVAKRLLSGKKVPPKVAKSKYDKLLGNSEFITAVTKSTADEEAVSTRLQLAIQAFS